MAVAAVADENPHDKGVPVKFISQQCVAKTVSGLQESKGTVREPNSGCFYASLFYGTQPSDPDNNVLHPLLCITLKVSLSKPFRRASILLYRIHTEPTHCGSATRALNVVHIVTCRAVRATKMTDSGSDDWIY
jgi:hypothetical protein